MAIRPAARRIPAARAAAGTRGAAGPLGRRREQCPPVPLTPLGTSALARQYVWLGLVHIVPRGLDHILFVLSLFLLAPRWRSLLTQVSAFTVAHTVTLGATMVGWISLPSPMVEPLIAASIAWVATRERLAADAVPYTCSRRLPLRPAARRRVRGRPGRARPACGRAGAGAARLQPRCRSRAGPCPAGGLRVHRGTASAPAHVPHVGRGAGIAGHRAGRPVLDGRAGVVLAGGLTRCRGPSSTLATMHAAPSQWLVAVAPRGSPPWGGRQAPRSRPSSAGSVSTPGPRNARRRVVPHLRDRLDVRLDVRQERPKCSLRRKPSRCPLLESHSMRSTYCEGSSSHADNS